MFLFPGVGVYVRKNSVLVGNRNRVNFIEGSNVTLTVADDGDEIDVTIASAGGGGGEANTASNQGSGSGWFKTKTGVDLEFKSLVLGSSKLSVVSNTNDLTVDAVEANFTLGNIGGTIATAKIADDAVTFAKMQNIATDRLIGRDTASSGDPEEITVSGGLEFTGSTGIQRSALTGDVTASAGSNSTTIANDAVTFAKMQNIATDRLIGRDTASSGDPEELTVSGGLEFSGSGGIQRSALTGDVTASAGSNATTIANDAVTFAKMQNITDARLLGRSSGSDGDCQHITIGTGLSLSSGALSASSNAKVRPITFGVGNGTDVITTGNHGFITVPYTGTITTWILLANETGSIVIDIWKDTYANHPPTVADTITASAKPTLSSVIKNQSSTLTGWTTSITAGDILVFNVDSVTTVKRIILQLLMDIT